MTKFLSCLNDNEYVYSNANEANDAYDDNNDNDDDDEYVYNDDNDVDNNSASKNSNVKEDTNSGLTLLRLT